MSEAVEVVIGVLAALLLLVSVYGVAIGCEAYLGGERLERCDRCHRRGWTDHGVVHALGCPTGFFERVTHPAIGARSLDVHDDPDTRPHSLGPSRLRHH